MTNKHDLNDIHEGDVLAIKAVVGRNLNKAAGFINVSIEAIGSYVLGAGFEHFRCERPTKLQIKPSQIIEILERKQTPEERIAELEQTNRMLEARVMELESNKLNPFTRDNVPRAWRQGRLFVPGLPIKENKND
jgi:hypothetical protein